jgi:N-acetylmuramoyl-L-alanine amidase
MLRWSITLLLFAHVAAAAPTVVIDPGHGGSNTGAPGRVAGAFEKQVTLAVARALQRRLEPEGVHVVLTRERDQYLTLRERVRRANAARPDCFISIHTNASPDHGRRGVETYVLARETAEVEARRAASRARGVEALLEELKLLDALRAGAQLATAIQSRLATTIFSGILAGHSPAGSDSLRSPIRDRGIKQAGYDVLAGVQAPAVLVEIGFIDHPVEGAALLRADVQRQIAQQLAEGVFDFLSMRRPARYAALGEPSGAR